MGTLPGELGLMQQCAIWLIKNLCIDTNAESATLEQTITHQGKSIGRYKIEITKIGKKS